MRRLMRATAVGIASSLLVCFAPPVMADSTGSPVLIDTVAAKTGTTDWTVSPMYAPQIGQSFTLDRPVLADSFVLHPDEVEFAKKVEYLFARYQPYYYRVLHANASMAATTRLNIWKSNDGVTIPVVTEPGKGFDVTAGGFTNVYSHEYRVPVEIGKPFVLPIEPAVQLDPGNYLVAWYFTFDDKRIFNLRFWGEVSGHSDGQWHDRKWLPTVCRYKPLPDTSPPGSAAYAADQWASPYGASPSGPPPGTIGYLTWFYAYVSKTPGCGTVALPGYAGVNKQGLPINKQGKLIKDPFNQKWQPMNTGDLDMQLTGTSL